MRTASRHGTPVLSRLGIVNVKAEESVLNDEGKVDVQKLNVLMFDNYCHGYYSLGEKEGQAWNAGMDLMK